MIISRLDGGLGNQMFQYAYGLYLARRHSTQLVLDASSYLAAPEHGYLLDKFCIQAEQAGPSHQWLIPPRYRAPGSSGWLPRLPMGYLRRHKETPFGFREDHLSAPDNRYLVGYWQSEKFLPGMRSELLRHFKLRIPLSSESQRVADRIRNANSAVLHVRRGDYVTNQQVAKLYHHLGEDYYRRSLHDWAATQSHLEVFVFSNDIAWCRENIDLPWKTHWVDHNTGQTAHEDLVLMSQAACCIIANSTFSWWAAWLNDRPNKVVYAPPTWFTPGTMDGSAIMPTAWKKLSPIAQQAA